MNEENNRSIEDTEELIFVTEQPLDTYNRQAQSLAANQATETIAPETVEVREPVNPTVTVDEQLKQQYNIQDGQPVIIIHNENNANQNAAQQVTQQVAPWIGHEKNKWVAFWLCFFLGTIGVHQFYCGYVGRGFIMIALDFTGIGWFVSSIWALVNLFQIGLDTYITRWGQMI